MREPGRCVEITVTGPKRDCTLASAAFIVPGKQAVLECDRRVPCRLDGCAGNCGRQKFRKEKVRSPTREVLSSAAAAGLIRRQTHRMKAAKIERITRLGTDRSFQRRWREIVPPEVVVTPPKAKWRTRRDWNSRLSNLRNLSRPAKPAADLDQLSQEADRPYRERKGNVTYMPKLRVHAFSMSLDGFGAGPDQDIDNPLGVGGMGLHGWLVGTQTFQKMIGKQGGTTGPDDDFARRGFENVGAWILGRNMFGPVRGEWPDDSWKGWWGDEPPYHTDVFVLTHHARKPIEMQGGTIFHFMTDGIHAALDKARASAKGKDVRLGGGAQTIRQYLEAGLLDEMHLAVSPVLLGKGENLLAGLDLPALGFGQVEYVSTPTAAHYVLKKKRG